MIVTAEWTSVVALQVVDALVAGIKRLSTRDGILLAGLFYLLNAVTGVVNALVVSAPTAPMSGPGTGPGSVAGTPPSPEALLPALGVVFGLSLVSGLVSVVLTIGALRSFVTETRLSVALTTRNLPLAFLNYVVGGLVYAILVLVGLVLLVVPGIAVMVVLAFWTVLVAVEDESFIAAFGDSWQLTEGSRLQLFGLGLLVVVVGFLISLPFAAVSGIVGFVTGGGTAAQVLSALVSPLGSAITTVITLGVISAAYRQLTTDGTDTGTAVSSRKSL